MQNPFRCFNSSPEVICGAVMLYVRYRLSLRQAENLLCLPKTFFANLHNANRPAVNEVFERDGQLARFDVWKMG